MADSDFVINNNVLTDYRGNERIISIPEGVTQIAPYAFSRNVTLNSVTIPASTWRIGSAAFSGCVNLEKVILQDNIRTIEDWAFEKCISLKEISVPSTLENISKRAFLGCSSVLLSKNDSENRSNDTFSMNTPSSNDTFTDEPEINQQENNPVNPVNTSKDSIIYNNLEIRIQNGDADAMYEMAQNYYVGKNNYKEDYKQAAYWYYQAAIKDHKDSQYELGRLYESGLGVEKIDLLQALDWYEKAARRGNKNAAAAENRIKVSLNRREKIDFKSIDLIFGEFDETLLNKYLKKNIDSRVYMPTKKTILTIKYHAYKGNQYAQYALGLLYQNKKISQNPLYVMYGEETADYWFIRSAELGYKKADEKLKQINVRVGRFQPQTAAINEESHFQQTKKELSSSEIDNLLRSANEGNRISQYQLATNYSYGINGFNSDDHKATEWFLKSAQQDYMDAQYEMGRRYESGTGVQKNYSEAFSWYSKAAAQGHTGAMTGAKRVKNKM